MDLVEILQTAHFYAYGTWAFKMLKTKMKLIKNPDLFLHLFQHGGNHGNVLVSRIRWRWFRLLPAEAEEHEDEDDADVDEDDEWEDGVADCRQRALLVSDGRWFGNPAFVEPCPEAVVFFLVLCSNQLNVKTWKIDKTDYYLNLYD